MWPLQWPFEEGRWNAMGDIPRMCHCGPSDKWKPFERKGQFQCVLGISILNSSGRTELKGATEQTFKGEPRCQELGRTSLPFIPKVRPSALVRRGDPSYLSVGEEGSSGAELRLEAQGAEAGGPLGSSGLLSVGVFHPSHALSVGYIIWSPQQPG